MTTVTCDHEWCRWFQSCERAGTECRYCWKCNVLERQPSPNPELYKPPGLPAWQVVVNDAR